MLLRIFGPKRKIRGATLIEWLMALVLISILGMVAIQVQNNQIKEKMFLDELTAFLRLGRKIAMTTGCEVQFGEIQQHQLGLLFRQNCDSEEFTRLIQGSVNKFNTITSPSFFEIKQYFPLYVDAKGIFYNQQHEFQNQLVLKAKAESILIDSSTGWVYVQKSGA